MRDLTGSAEFEHNAEVMRALVAELRQKLGQGAGGGGEVSRNKVLCVPKTSYERDAALESPKLAG